MSVVLSLGLASALNSNIKSTLPEQKKEVPRYLQNYWYISTETVFGVRILGSEETRRGSMYAINYVKPEPKAKYKGAEGQLVYSGYFMVTAGTGFVGEQLPQMKSWGVSVAIRYWNEYLQGSHTYIEFGWGLVYNNITSRDLDSKINSTPMIGVGIEFMFLDTEWIAGLRYYHMSNAGSAGENQGFNAVNFMIGIRF